MQKGNVRTHISSLLTKSGYLGPHHLLNNLVRAISTAPHAWHGRMMTLWLNKATVQQTKYLEKNFLECHLPESLVDL